MIRRRSPLRVGILRVQLALLGIVAPVSVAAVSYSGAVANWEMRDGLPSHKIMAALQTRDGYIWVGTWDGLARFDGASFARFDAGRTPGLVESSATAFCESPDGALWIGHGSGAVTRLLNGKFTNYPAPAQREGTRIQNLACDEAGDVWGFDIAGHLFRVRDDFTLIPETGPAGGIYFMAGSPQGVLAIIARGKLSVLEQGRLRPVELGAELAPFVRGVCSSSDGGWWLVNNGRLWKWKSSEWTLFPQAVPSGPAPVFTMRELRDGRVVGATYDRGAWIIHPTGAVPDQSFTHASGFVSDWISSVFEDREGGLWFGTGTAGLCRVAEKRITMLAPPDALKGRPALTVAESADGTLWIGTEGSGVYRHQNGTWTQYRPNQGLWNPYVWSVTTTPDGSLWAGTWGSGVFRFQDEQFVPPDNRSGTSGAGVAAMIASVRGGLLVGGRDGIYRWNGHEATWLESGPVRSATNVRALLEEEAGGVVWAGSWGGGLIRIGPAGITQYTRADGLSSNDVNCLHRDRSGVLWIGTNGGGLNRLKDGRFDAVGTAHGLSDNSIGHIAEDASGNLWLSSRSGLMRVTAADLHACADRKLDRLDVETFGHSDGLTTLNFSAAVQPAGCTLRGGQLAFATDRGIAVIDPANLSRNRVPPPVYIEWIEIEGRRVAIGEAPSATHQIPAGFQRLEIKYTALSFAGPDKVVFSRQLHPLERQPTIVSRERSVVYNYLPPGTYTFRVGAANNDGVWNREPRVLTLEVLPFFWQTAWFRTLALGLLAAASGTIAWYISRRRLQRRVELLEREGAIERERTRIAHDMHDELGSQLTRISMLSESARQQSADPARLGERLGQIYDTARDVTKAMDEIVWTVNPRHDTFDSLLSYVEKYAVDFLTAAGVTCRIDAPFETIEWTPNAEVRHNLFLCLKETLTNVVRHAGATQVVLTINIDGSNLVVQIADNGRGFATDAMAAGVSARPGGGNGLANLRARMARLGGQCDIVSLPGQGCTITLRVPVTAAARSPRPRDGSSR